MELGEEQHELCNISHCAPDLPDTCHVYSANKCISLVCRNTLCTTMWTVVVRIIEQLQGCTQKSEYISEGVNY